MPLSSKSWLTGQGFTLAELLIALAILGVIATFTIPKVLSAQQNGQNSAKAKEAVSTISAAYQVYSLEQGLDSDTDIKDFAEYINYVEIDTTSTVDGSPNDNLSYSCASRLCLKLHSGAIMLFGLATGFGEASNLRLQWFLIDPDGTYNGDSSSVWFAIYYDGRVSSWANITPNSLDDAGNPYNPGDYDPAWFSW